MVATSAMFDGSPDSLGIPPEAARLMAEAVVEVRDLGGSGGYSYMHLLALGGAAAAAANAGGGPSGNDSSLPPSAWPHRAAGIEGQIVAMGGGAKMQAYVDRCIIREESAPDHGALDP